MKSSRQQLWLLVALFFLVGFLIYGSSLSNDFVDYDDTRLVVENESIRHVDPAAWKQIFSSYEETLYTPLLFVSYQIDYALGGLNPTVYHTHSLIIHVIIALLMSVLLYQLTKQSLASVFCGLLFLVHPLNTETVAWVSLRKDLLATMFGLLMIILYLYSQKENDKRAYSASVVCFVLALLSKPSGITIPLILPLLDAMQNRTWKKQISFYVPLFVLSFAFLLINSLNANQAYQLSEFSLYENLLLSAKSSIMLLLWFIAPLKLSVIHPFTDPISLLSLHIFLPVILFLFLAGTAWKIRKRNSIYWQGLAIYFLLLIPTFRGFRTGENFEDVFFTTEHYAYLPMLGLLLILTTLLSRKKMTVPFAFLLVVFGIMANAQAAVWGDTQSLFLNVTHKYNNAQTAHNNLGVIYAKQELPAFAIREYAKSIHILPTGKVYANLGQAYLQAGELPEALDAFEHALTFNPLNAPVQLNIGVVYVKQGQYDQAITAFRRAAALDPNSALPWRNIGFVREILGDEIGAKEAFDRAQLRSF